MKRSLHICLFFGLFLFINCSNGLDNRALEALNVREYASAPFTYFETGKNALTISDILSEQYQSQFDSLRQNKLMEREKTYWFKADLSKVSFNKNHDWVLDIGGYAINNLYLNKDDSLAVSRAGSFDPLVRELEYLNWRFHEFNASNLFEGKYIYVELRENYFPRRIFVNQISVISLPDFRYNSVAAFVARAEYNFRAVLFLGGIAFLLIYTFGIYFIYKDRLYLLYGIYLVFILMYLGVKMYPAQSSILFGSFPIMNHAWNEVTQILVNYWYTRFVRKFLDAKTLYPVFNKVARWVEWVILGFVVAVIVTIFANPLSTWLYYIVTAERLLMILFALCGGIYILLNLKDRRGVFIITGSTALLVGSVTALIMGDIQYFMIGVMIEIFIFAMGLGILMKRKEDEKTELNKEVEKVKMKALQTQMNPHFIFNSLNSIRSYMIKHETKEASGYLSKFSRLIRQILEYSTEEFITLKQELQVLSLYIQIEQLRFRDEFGFEVEVDEGLDQEELMVPPLIVQPFLENAIWHGLMQKKGAKKIELIVNNDGAKIRIIVRDNGIGREEANRNLVGAPKESKSMAIDLTSQRLEMLGENSQTQPSVSIIDLYNDDRSPGGTEVRLEIPKITQSSL